MPFSRPSDTRTLSAVMLVSFASLLLELGLTRLFSVVLFYHFAFLAISVALLGLGAGGVFAHLRRDALAKWETSRLGAWSCCGSAIAIFLALEVILHLPISLDLTRWNFAKLTVMYLAAAVPFFFTGLLFSVVFARIGRDDASTDKTSLSTLYGADLLGGSLACLAVVPLLNFIGGPNAILFASVAMALAALLWAEESAQKRVAAGIAVAFIVLIAANFAGRLVDIIYA